MSALIHTDGIRRGAVIEGDHRFALFRSWADVPSWCMFVMLNPSIADHEQDDPTVRKCMGFARRWGCTGVVIVNLYTYRTPSPKALKAAGYPNHPDADVNLLWALQTTPSIVVCAWGRHGQRGRAREVMKLLEGQGHRAAALRINKDGSPQHPLYVPYDVEPVEFRYDAD